MKSLQENQFKHTIKACDQPEDMNHVEGQFVAADQVEA